MFLRVISVVASLLVFVGTVLRMWDTMAEVDAHGEFAPRTSREEFHRFRLMFTALGRFKSPTTTDMELHYLRTAQGWFFLWLGAGVVLFLNLTRLLR